MMYICYADLNDKSRAGISKKISSQISVLQKYFGTVYHTSYSGTILKLYDADRLIDKVSALSPLECFETVKKWIEHYGIQRTYIRNKYPVNKWYISFLKWQKEHGIRSLIEIPTYPYDKEIYDVFELREDQYYRMFIKDFIEQIVIVSGNEDVNEAFGVPAIMIQNGVDLEKNPLKKFQKHSDDIVLTAVANFNRWHGYERLLKGMQLYYAGNPDLVLRLNMIGDGGERGFYQNLVTQYGLEPYVSFKGVLTGTELDQIFDQSDIAVGTLGLYKIGLQGCYPIKLGEYCARGIPFIYAYDDIRFQGNEDFLLKFPNDDTPIDIQEVIKFKKKTDSIPDLNTKMRQLAKNKFTWETAFQPIVNFFNR